jgi:uncharacterized protein YktA (UPF0223 family)
MKFPASISWIKHYFEKFTSDLDLSSTTRNEPFLDLYDFGGLHLETVDGQPRRAYIYPSEIRTKKFDLFDLGMGWLSEIEFMCFHDFVQFFYDKHISASRLFLVYVAYHAPIIRIAESQMLLEFEEETPYKLFRITILLDGSEDLRNFKGIDLIA